MSGTELLYEKLSTNLDVYDSHSPEDFSKALDEINSYCRRQLPLELNTVFKPTCFDISLDEEYAVICGEYGNIANFHLHANKILRDEEVCPEVPILSVSLVLNDRQVVVASAQFEIVFMDYPSFEILYRYFLDHGPAFLKAFRYDDELFVFNLTSELRRVKLSMEYDFYTDNFTSVSKNYEQRIFALEIDHSGQTIALGFENGSILLSKYNDLTPLHETSPYTSAPTQLVFSNEGTSLSASFSDFSVLLWEIGENLVLKSSDKKHSELITGLAFARNSKYLLSCSLDSFIQVTDTSIESSPYSVNLNPEPIRMLKVGKSGQTVFYIQDPNYLMIWKVPLIPQNARYRKHQAKIVKVLFVYRAYELISISEDGEINLWDFRCHSLMFTMGLNTSVTDAKLVLTSRSLLISSPSTKLYLVNLETQSVTVLETSFSIVSFQISEDEKQIAISDHYSRVVLHSFPEMKRLIYLKGHLDIITGSIFINTDKSLITGSKDKTLGIWDVITGARSVTMKGHSSEVLSILSSRQGYILSGDQLGTVIVWSKEGFLLYHLTPPESEPILRIYLSYYNEYLITLQPSSVNYWQMNNLSLIFQKSTTEATSLAVDADEKHVTVAEGSSVYIEENSLECNHLHITGKSLGSVHRFMKFLIQSQEKDSKVPYEMNNNHWIIAPYLIGPAHILAYSNRFVDLQKALFFPGNKANFFSSIKSESPLTICVEKEFKNCIDICLKYMKIESQGREGKPRNPRAYIPLENCLTSLNRIEYSYISKLYESLFVENSDPYLPRFCKIEADLPKWDPSDQFNLFSDKFYPNEMFPSTGRPVIFHQSAIPLSIDPGSNDSIEFMESLLDCPDHTIFRSKIVIEYLMYKWSLLKRPTYIVGLVYILYLVMLGLHIVVLLESKLFLFLLILVHSVLVFWEVLQIATDFGDYWKNAWNVLDQLRSISFSFYAIMAWGGDYNTDILLSVLIFSWTRGIGCFRMFDETRYMVRLIVQVIIDITTFFFMLFYATLAFAFVYYMRNPEAKSFAMYLTVAYRLDLGDLETDLHSYFDWGIFFVASMINPLIMLNLLIAIMSDTASYVDTVDDILGYRELAQMIIEIEKVMYWKKHFPQKHFLHKLDYFTVSDEEVDKKAVKVALIKKQVVRNNKIVKNLEVLADGLANSELTSEIEHCRRNQEEIESICSKGLEKSKKLIQVIQDNLGIKSR
jgi:WD40 repeat protein